MAIKHLIAGGIGFASDGVKYIPTLGLDSYVVVLSDARHLLCRGIGFNPGSAEFIPGLGMTPFYGPAPPLNSPRYSVLGHPITFQIVRPYDDDPTGEETLYYGRLQFWNWQWPGFKKGTTSRYWLKQHHRSSLITGQFSGILYTSVAVDIRHDWLRVMNSMEFRPGDAVYIPNICGNRYIVAHVDRVGDFGMVEKVAYLIFDESKPLGDLWNPLEDACTPCGSLPFCAKTWSVTFSTTSNSTCIDCVTINQAWEMEWNVSGNCYFSGTIPGPLVCGNPVTMIFQPEETYGQLRLSAGAVQVYWTLTHAFKPVGDNLLTIDTVNFPPPVASCNFQSNVTVSPVFE